MKRWKGLLGTVLLLCILCAGASAKMEFPDLARPFEERFLAEGCEWTPNGYRSENIWMEVTAQRICDSDVYVADVYVRTAECLRRAFGGGEWNASSEKLAELAAQSGGVLALTGDNSHLLKAGWLVGNGELCRSRGNNMRDLCVLYTNGVMQIHYATADHALIAQQTENGEIWQTFVFGPSLLDEQGKALEDFSASDVEPANPRAVIGYYEPGHYCLVQVDGRGTSSALEEKQWNSGMTLAELAQLMETLGCQAAYNLDGGQSAAMWFGDGVISTPYHNGRAVGDAIVLCEPEIGIGGLDAFLVDE